MYQFHTLLMPSASVRLAPMLVLLPFLTACTGLPKGIEPVEGFELERYLGTWYEIARLDHAFERGLQQVTAEYALREDGGVSVVNRGYAVADDEWKVAEGKAYFMRERDLGYLKVSFFGPFYGSYVIFELDKQEYRYAFVTGYDKSYLWLLARSPQVSEALIQRFVASVEARGFAAEELIFVDHQVDASSNE